MVLYRYAKFFATLYLEARMKDYNVVNGNITFFLGFPFLSERSTCWSSRLGVTICLIHLIIVIHSAVSTASWSF